MLWSQINDDFSDSEILNNPSWIGDVGIFKVNTSYQLQLNQLNPRTDIANVTYLSTYLGLNDSLEWNFSIRLNFSPSDDNKARVYLLADKSDLTQPLNGYFLQFGEALSTDAIELFYQQGTQIQSVCRGTNGKIAAAFDIDVKVIFKRDGSWLIYVDWNKTANYVLECSGNNQNLIPNPYFGFLCRYTSSNATRFYFDNVKVNYIYKDTEAPIVLSLDAISPAELRLIFNEAVNTTAAGNIDNYLIQQSNEKPTSVTLNPLKPAEVLLKFENNFTANVSQSLLINSIKDMAGNQRQNLSANFIFSQAQFADIVFNEIMADPNPPVGLPDAEYLEIYNRAAYDINLTNWKLKLGTTEKLFPAMILKSGEYLILCSTTLVDALKAYGLTAGFSSFSLTNAGQYLGIIDEYGKLIDEVTYADIWYLETAKVAGGWSLEKIQPSNICLSNTNWKASIHASGGTPGSKNSIYSDVLISPQALNTRLKNETSVLLSFNQSMNAQSLSDLQNYSVNQSVGNPKQIIISNNNQTVELIFETKFTTGISYQLTINNTISNCIGQNITGTLNFNFELPKIAEYGDIIISEIMADPTPVQALPDAEYIELYNRTIYPISLNAWKLAIGSTNFTFPDIQIPAKSFLILTHTNTVTLLNSYGNTLAIPSLSISNSGTSIVLKNNLSQIIHYIKFTDKWYGESYKADGGWSLEMISTTNFCEQSINWSASQNTKGGSPGAANSLNHIKPDYQAPKISGLNVINPNTVLVSFSKSMDSLALKNIQNYAADNSLGSPNEIKITAPDYNSAQLKFSNSMAEAIIYEITFSASLLGCGGSSLQNLKKRFALPQEPVFGDVVINEVLFNSWTSDGVYVELYNRSDKVFDMRQLLFSRYVPNAFDTTYYSVQPTTGQLFPEEYLVLCKNKTEVLNTYYSSNPDQIISFDNFPSLTNTDGKLLVSKSAKRNYVIDGFSYNEKMHHPLLNNVRGVALERLSPNVESNNPNNWQSAAAGVNYGTPAYQNSQYQETSESAEVVSIKPEIFSPDLDGIDDILQIQYQFAESGYTLNLTIYNAHGQKINHLVKNELMGISGQIFWDGTTEKGEKAAIGIYILYIEYFNLNGKVEKLKKTCVLGGRL